MNYLLDFKSIDDDNVSLVFKLIDKIIINDNKIKINYRFKVQNHKSNDGWPWVGLG